MRRMERDPLETLREANPVDAGDVSSASLARVRARVNEVVMREDAERSRPAWQRRPALVGAAGAAMVVALVAVLGFGRGFGLVPDPSSGPGIGMCVETYSPATLARRGIAFAGTVEALADDDVTFRVDRAYRGITGSTVTLRAPGMTGTSITIGADVSLEIGQAYLVAGDDQFAWGCGFTQPFDPAVATTWAGVFQP